MDNSTTGGTVLGIVAGVYTSISDVITAKIPIHTFLGNITASDILETAFLAFVGGVLGALGAELVKLIKKKVFKK